MERFTLENKVTSPAVRVLQIIFGLTCIFIAGWWAVYMLSSDGNNGYWIATLFMLGFGAFQIYSGLGHATKYIIIDDRTLIIKKTALARKTILMSGEIKMIEILPLSVNIITRADQNITISFALSIAGTIDNIKDALIAFAKKCSIKAEEKSDRL
jgi:uncharacterized membrane protein YiaA